MRTAPNPERFKCETIPGLPKFQNGRRGFGLSRGGSLAQGLCCRRGPELDCRDDVSEVGRPGRWTMRAPYARYRRFLAALDK